MNEVDYSQMRSIADEPHWNDFVQSFGGQLVAPLIKRQGIQNADYIFPDAKVIAELKILETEFAHSKEMFSKVTALAEKYPNVDPDDPTQPLGRELLMLLKKPLQRIVNKANRQIKQTKAELGLDEWSGVLICVNDNFRGVPPAIVIGLIGHILSGTSYKSITAVIYQTNHYIEMAENPYANLLWSPMYSENASDDLVDFVNNLGRGWRAYSDKIEGPFDFSGEAESIRLDQATVVTGVLRNYEFKG